MERREAAFRSIRENLVRIPPGSFMMGATAHANEQPVHRVTISYSFYMGRYEVTQEQWQAVIGSNPSEFSNCGGNCPVEQVPWNDAQVFINALNAANDGYQYRLPSEAEWEYACRAGTTGDYAGDLDSMAWYGANSNNTTHLVGMKQPNAFGLYDMHGNVWEWCQDYWHDNYNGAPSNGSAWMSGGDPNSRVLRGGSWSYNSNNLTSAYRLRLRPDLSGYAFGFRVVAVARQ